MGESVEGWAEVTSRDGRCPRCPQAQSQQVRGYRQDPGRTSPALGPRAAWRRADVPEKEKEQGCFLGRWGRMAPHSTLGGSGYEEHPPDWGRSRACQSKVTTHPQPPLGRCSLPGSLPSCGCGHWPWEPDGPVVIKESDPSPCAGR